MVFEELPQPFKKLYKAEQSPKATLKKCEKKRKETFEVDSHTWSKIVEFLQQTTSSSIGMGKADDLDGGEVKIETN